MPRRPLPSPALRRHLAWFAEPWPGFVAVAVMLVWAVHDGGYDADTWYWGALLMLALAVAVVMRRGLGRGLSRPLRVAMWLFAAYTVWSYLSISWAASPGDALQGADRTLLYLLVFVVMGSLAWEAPAARAALLLFTLGTGALAVLILLRLSSGHGLGSIVVGGRLDAPTGYFNSSVALFSAGALTSVVLATRRELPTVLRATLLAGACGSVELAIIGQSRGWLFTLPFVLLAAIAVVPDRLRTLGYALVAAVPAVAPVRQLIAVYGQNGASHAAARAGGLSLACCAAVLVAAILIAEGDQRQAWPAIPPARRRLIGGLLALVLVGGVIAGGVAATHGDPFGFVRRQWNGFSRPTPAGSTGSHFATVGSGRYDFWRVSLDAVSAHPLGGLGQDNFADYYVTRRRTSEEPSWTHSLEMRLLAHTGIVGFLLFGAFLLAAVLAARRAARHRGPAAAAIAAAALMPCIVWLVHGSVDWFWEIPALSGPALGFLAMSGAVAPGTPVAGAGPPAGTGPPAGADPAGAADQPGRWGALPRPVRLGVGAAALACGVVALGFPYLSVREVSQAADEQARNPGAALSDLQRAAQLNPLSAAPDRLAGTIALRVGLPNIAQQRFLRATDREPGGWFGWFGAGLAASTLGDVATAERDLSRAARINFRQPAVQAALQRVSSARPLSPAQAFRLLVVVN